MEAHKILAAIVVLIIAYILVFGCGCKKGRMYDPAIDYAPGVPLAIPGSFEASDADRFPIPNYNYLLGTRYGSA